jgi:hypothetical protein
MRPTVITQVTQLGSEMTDLGVSIEKLPELRAATEIDWTVMKEAGGEERERGSIGDVKSERSGEKGPRVLGVRWKRRSENTKKRDKKEDQNK